MPIHGPRDDGDPVLRQIEADFEALVRLLDRAIEHLLRVDPRSADLEYLVQAKEAAERGAKAVRKNRT